MFSEPPPSQGDLHFRVFGFPVRIHPFFWLVALFLGAGIGQSRAVPPAVVMCWMVAMPVSILAHELGHAVMQRRYGGRPRIVLHGMGGLAICEDCERSTWSQIAISLAGPVAGFLLAAVLLVVTAIATGTAGVSLVGLSPEQAEGLDGTRLLGMTFYWSPFVSAHLNRFVGQMLWINVMWGAINLLPIYPLDGGQVARELCLLGDPRSGMLLSLRISLVAAAVMALFSLFVRGSLFTALLFGYLAYSSFKTLEAYRAHRW